jgi:hypothetical protein
VRARFTKRFTTPWAVAEAALAQAVFWLATLSQTHRHRLSVWLLVFDVVLLVVGLVSLVIMARLGVRLLRLMAGLVVTVSLLLANFSWFYWSYGGAGGFSKPLTHLKRRLLRRRDPEHGWHGQHLRGQPDGAIDPDRSDVGGHGSHGVRGRRRGGPFCDSATVASVRRPASLGGRADPHSGHLT